MPSFLRFLPFLGLFFVALTWAGSPPKKQVHREHEAHVHGTAELALAFEATKGRIEFKAAAEGVLGFEHAAKSDADRKVLAASLAKFEKDIASLVEFAHDKKCQISKEKIEQVFEAEHSNHSNFIATYSVVCAAPILGSALKLDFHSLPGLHDIDVTILIDSLQKSLELKGQALRVELK